MEKTEAGDYTPSLHSYKDDWTGLQEAVSNWLSSYAKPSPTLLRYVGLLPDLNM